MKCFVVKHKVIFLLIFLFFLFLSWNLLITDIYADEVWNYGFSYAISHGEIPYKDFNMVITPLYPFLMSLFSSNILFFHIIHALILTGMAYVLYRLLDKKMWIPLIFLFLPYPATYPSYNILILFFFSALLLLEENHKNDILIGFIVGLSILTKQSIGVCLLLPCLFYSFSFSKFKKRLIGIFIPCLIFLFYLVFSHSLFEFLDYCLFGLFDFSGNRPSFNIYYILGIFYVVLHIYFIVKNQKDFAFYYSLAMFSMMIPLFEIYHFMLTVVSFIIVLCMRKNFKIPRPSIIFIGIFIGISIVHLQRLSSGVIYPNNIKHFEYRLFSKEAILYFRRMNDSIHKYSDREVVILSNNSYFLRIMRNEKISSLDLINYGNHGYHSSQKILQEIKNKKDCIVFLNKKDLQEARQTDKSGLQYVIEHGVYQESIAEFDVYLLE